MKLLEKYHKDLADLLKKDKPVVAPAKTETKAGGDRILEPPPPTTRTFSGSPYRPESKSFPAAHRPPRDASSSIVSNLASARGIPSNRQRRNGQASAPAVAPQNAEGKILNNSRQRLSSNISKIATASSAKSAPVSHTTQDVRSTTTTPSVSREETLSDKSIDEHPKNDEAFNRFYNTFESLFSKLSAPLAFAGLPLNPDADLSAPTAAVGGNNPAPRGTQRHRPSRRATVDPEYSTIFSPAALAAVREEPGANLGGAESFYLVPTTGGTMPYASILGRHRDRHHDRTLSRDSTGLSDDLDNFVDARESPGPPSPLLSRKDISKTGTSSGGKTLEELQLENDSLRGVLDETSRRLWQFEMSAQMGSVAIHQSIKASLNQKSANSPAASETGVEGRTAELEEELARMKKEVGRLGREKEKLNTVVVRYRERWEKLKEGARGRRGGEGNGDGKGASELGE